MSTDSIQHIVADVRNANAEKGTDGALNALQQEYLAYSKTHTKEETAQAMRQVEQQLMQTDANCALAIAADWAKQHKDNLTDDGEIRKHDLFAIQAADPNLTDLNGKSLASPFDKFMAGMIQDNYKRITTAHKDTTFGADKETITMADLDALLQKNNDMHNFYAKAKPFIDNGGELFQKLARMHMDANNKDGTYFTWDDVHRALDADGAAKLANGKENGLFSDQEVAAIKELLNSQKYESWKTMKGHFQVWSADKMAQSAGFANAGDMQAVIKAQQ
jgi:hypothetical protein